MAAGKKKETYVPLPSLTRVTKSYLLAYRHLFVFRRQQQCFFFLGPRGLAAAHRTRVTRNIQDLPTKAGVFKCRLSRDSQQTDS